MVYQNSGSLSTNKQKRHLFKTLSCRSRNQKKDVFLCKVWIFRRIEERHFRASAVYSHWKEGRSRANSPSGNCRYRVEQKNCALRNPFDSRFGCYAEIKPCECAIDSRTNSLRSLVYIYLYYQRDTGHVSVSCSIFASSCAIQYSSSEIVCACFQLKWQDIISNHDDATIRYWKAMRGRNLRFQRTHYDLINISNADDSFAML